MFIVKNLTDFRKTMETGVDPRLNIDTSAHRNVVLYFFKAGLRLADDERLENFGIYERITPRMDHSSIFKELKNL